MKPIFDERRIREFFNAIDPELPFKIVPMNARQAGESDLGSAKFTSSASAVGAT
jgi:hypothetical protein